MTTKIEVLGREIDLDGLTVVDVGCGDGVMARWLRTQGASVLGCDCSVPAIERARELDPDHADTYLIGVGEDLPFDDDMADLVVYSYSLHHVPVESMDEAIREARRVLRPGGRLVSIEPVAEGPSYQLNRLVHDEAAVRLEAQAALDRATSAGFSAGTTTAYMTESRFDSFDDWAEDMIADSEERAAILAANRDRCREEFDRQAEPRDGSYLFPHPNLMRVLVRAE